MDNGRSQTMVIQYLKTQTDIEMHLIIDNYTFQCIARKSLQFTWCILLNSIFPKTVQYSAVK